MKVIIDNRSEVANSTVLLMIAKHIDTIELTQNRGWISTTYRVDVIFKYNSKSIRFVITDRED
jgi:hypothetical protein